MGKHPPVLQSRVFSLLYLSADFGNELDMIIRTVHHDHMKTHLFAKYLMSFFSCWIIFHLKFHCWACKLLSLPQASIFIFIWSIQGCSLPAHYNLERVLLFAGTAGWQLCLCFQQCLLLLLYFVFSAALSEMMLHYLKLIFILQCWLCRGKSYGSTMLSFCTTNPKPKIWE